jgi:hypothetical protein
LNPDRPAGYTGPNFEYSEVDRLILRLNQQGQSAGKISISLRAYGIELSKSGVHRHLTELRQDPENGVRVNHKHSNRKPKSELKWYSIMSRLRDETDAYTLRMGFKPSSRTMIYHFQDLGLITAKDVNQFIAVTVKARLGWTDSNGELLYPKLDIDCFSDDSRKTAGVYDDRRPRPPGPPGPIDDPDEYIEYEISRLKQAPCDYEGIGEEGTPSQIGGYWYGQPEYVEVWEEKNDLLAGFEKILASKHVKIRANKGYSSLEFLYECTEELKKLMDEKGLEPQHIHIKYCGDWDPSGVGIDYYIKKRLRQLGIPGVDFERVAVTPEQIHEYKLPLMSIEQTENKKGPNPNLKEFKRLYGNAATHLNAFFTEKHFADFSKILLESIDKHWTKSIYDQMVEEYENMEPEEPDSYSPEQLESIRSDMRRKITEAFKPGWEKEGEEDEDENNDE